MEFTDFSEFLIRSVIVCAKGLDYQIHQDFKNLRKSQPKYKDSLNQNLEQPKVFQLIFKSQKLRS